MKEEHRPATRPSGIVPKGYVPLVNIPPLPPPPKNLNVAVGDKVVHPSHGLGEIIAIEQREIGGTKGEFFIIRILDNGMRVMVPRASAQSAGLRPVMSGKEADKVLETMKAREVAVDLQPWSRRFRAYTEMIKSGSPHEVAKVLRDMYRLKFDKELSFGERRLLDQAKSLLIKELAAAKGVTEAALQGQVDEMFRNWSRPRASTGPAMIAGRAWSDGALLSLCVCRPGPGRVQRRAGEGRRARESPVGREGRCDLHASDHAPAALQDAAHDQGRVRAPRGQSGGKEDARRRDDVPQRPRRGRHHEADAGSGYMAEWPDELSGGGFDAIPPYDRRARMLIFKGCVKMVDDLRAGQFRCGEAKADKIIRISKKDDNHAAVEYSRVITLDPQLATVDAACGAVTRPGPDATATFEKTADKQWHVLPAQRRRTATAGSRYASGTMTKLGPVLRVGTSPRLFERRVERVEVRDAERERVLVRVHERLLRIFDLSRPSRCARR